MIEDILPKILDKTDLIVPLDDNIIQNLDGYSLDFVLGEKFILNTFNSIVYSYLNNTCEESFRKYIQRRLHDDGIEIRIPNCVFNALNFYVIYLSIKDKDDIEEELIQEYVLSLKNSLLKKINHFNTLSFQNYLVTLFGEYNFSLEKDSPNSIVYPSNFVKKVCSQDFTVDLMTEESLDELKSAAYMAWQKNVGDFICNCKEENSFKKSALILDNYFATLPNIDMAVCPTTLLKRISFKSNHKREMKDILSELKDIDGLAQKEVINSTSSIILINIPELTENIEDSTWLNEKITPREFFVYLFFELLLEYKLAQDDNGK